jgi:hypothetical protein
VSVLDEIGADQVAQTPVETLTRSTYAVIANALGEPTEMPVAPPVPAASHSR